MLLGEELEKLWNLSIMHGTFYICIKIDNDSIFTSKTVLDTRSLI